MPRDPNGEDRSAARHADATKTRPEIEGPISRINWAEFALRCPGCGGRLEFIALINETEAIRKILTHLELPAERPRIAPARDPP